MNDALQNTTCLSAVLEPGTKSDGIPGTEMAPRLPQPALDSLNLCCQQKEACTLITDHACRVQALA